MKQEFFGSHDNSTDLVKTHARYWLTANGLLSPAQTVSTSYTGEVKVETVWKVDVVVEGVPVTFGKRYRYRHTDGETISWSELVAEYELTGTAQTFENG